MLQHLYVKNVALISETDVDFLPGLNIITGETGAGKSIIIDSINLVLGGRADRDLIKYGESKARIEATFDISGNTELFELLNQEGLDAEDNTLTISRELNLSPASASGLKSYCRINGCLVNISVVKAVCELIVDVHGQHEHQSLLSAKKHINFLDAYAGEIVSDLKTALQKLYADYYEVKKRLNSGFISEGEKQRRIDILQYQINEIENAKLKVGEEEKLLSEKELLSNSEFIAEKLKKAYSLLIGSDSAALYSVKEASRCMDKLSSYSKEYEESAAQLNELYYSLEDIAYLVRDYSENVSFDPNKLDKIESRLEEINQLERKYGESVAAVSTFLDNAKRELSELISNDEIRQKDEKLLAAFKQQYYHIAEKLSNARKEKADEFSEMVMKELSDTGLSKALFSVSFTPLEGEVPSKNGTDNVEFMLSANPGEPLKPLSKVASGGEISRIMLALKTVLSDFEAVSCMIFDEIDTGISGKTAVSVGSKMYALGKKRQIIAITHLPAIAAYANNHFVVKKTQTDNLTTSTLSLLTEEQHCVELASIMGSTDSLSIEHAKAMIYAAKENSHN